MNNRRRFWLRRFAAPASISTALFCFAVAPTVQAQKIAPPKPKSEARRKKDQELEKAIGKTDADLFNGIMNSFGDAETLLHMVTETTANVTQGGVTINISGRTEMRGSYGGAFNSDHEVTYRRGDQSVPLKTQFVCDGKTLWTIKPDAKQYTEQPLSAAKPTLGKLIMSGSLDIVAATGASRDDDKPSTTKLESAHVAPALWKGVPCRALTIVYTDKGKAGEGGTMTVYVAGKRLRGIKMVDKDSETPATITETVKVMETMTPPPNASLFHFTTPEGFVKVDKFAD